MSYRVTRGPDERPSILLQGEPLYCTALVGAPPTKEPELNNGLWLVMVFAAWSVPDIEAIHTALAAVKHFHGLVQLGLRPFDDAAEHGTWCPGLANAEESPLWVLLRDGSVCKELRGFPTEQALVQVVGSTFSLGSATA